MPRLHAGARPNYRVVVAMSLSATKQADASERYSATGAQRQNQYLTCLTTHLAQKYFREVYYKILVCEISFLGNCARLRAGPGIPPSGCSFTRNHELAGQRTD